MTPMDGGLLDDLNTGPPVPFRPIVPPPEKMREVDIKAVEGKVIIDKNSRLILNSSSVGEIHYKGDPNKGVFSISVDGSKIKAITHKSEDIIKLARAIQADQIKESASKDQEGNIDHLSMAKEILTPSEPSDIIQVLDGTDHPPFSSFPGNNAESLKITIHYIESNNLQEVAPWSAIWNLWKCLEAVANEK